MYITGRTSLPAAATLNHEYICHITIHCIQEVSPDSPAIHSDKVLITDNVLAILIPTHYPKWKLLILSADRLTSDNETRRVMSSHMAAPKCSSWTDSNV